MSDQMAYTFNNHSEKSVEDVFQPVEEQEVEESILASSKEKPGHCLKKSLKHKK